MTRRTGLKASIAGAAGAVLAPLGARAQALKGGTLRIALLTDIVNFDPHQFSAVNMPVMKNIYDALVEYTAEGRPEPSLASAWAIAPDNKSITLTLRTDVKFHSGAPFDAEAVAVNLKKCADPAKGKSVFPSMGIVADWVVVNSRTVRINFKNPVPEKQITDLVQFVAIIDPAVIDTVETRPGGTGAYTLAERVLGQRVRLVANPSYWRAGEPVCKDVVCTVFSDENAAAAALESGTVDMIYGAGGRTGVRLRNAGFQLLRGPGQSVQVFRINTTRAPFRNQKFRQAFQYLLDRQAILRVGYGGLGEVTAQPWVRASPAFDPKLEPRYAYDIEKGRALLKESGLTEAQMSDWALLVDSSREADMGIAQIVQATLKRVGIDVKLDLKSGAEYIDALLTGKFAATFAGIGSVQKFPARITLNSIYRIANNPVLGSPHPHPEYVQAIERVSTTIGPPEAVQAGYDNLNSVLFDVSFGVATNTFDFGLIVAAKNLSVTTLDIDNILIARTIGFR
ncbi:MAG: ABC transporter substrate-binding protein [Alphaproteobacteria bacterium]|nr:ABC transporter substrate-binding protein [Alphaproteobacteria bacterium]